MLHYYGVILHALMVTFTYYFLSILCRVQDFNCLFVVYSLFHIILSMYSLKFLQYFILCCNSLASFLSLSPLLLVYPFLALGLCNHHNVMNKYKSVNCLYCYVCNSLDCLYMHCVFDTYHNLELRKDPNVISRTVMYKNITSIFMKTNTTYVY